MKPCFNPTCDRHGHMLTGIGEWAQTMALFVLPTIEEIMLLSEADSEPTDSSTRNFNYLSCSGRQKTEEIPLKTLAAEKVESTRLSTKKTEPKALSIRRIITAVNLTKKCEATVRYAAEIARHYNAALYVCYVFWPSMRTQGDHHDLIDREQREFRHKLGDLADQVRGSVPIRKAALLAGEPAKRLSTLAQDVHADLIVAASSDPILTQLLTVDGAVKMPCPVLFYHAKNA